MLNHSVSVFERLNSLISGNDHGMPEVTAEEEPSSSSASENRQPTPQPDVNIEDDPDLYLIKSVNALESKCLASGYTLDVALPRIVVVGSQSAGKSSTLENVIGREFLPRGDDLVTRRPILIKLIPTKTEEDYAVFGNGENETRFTDFNLVKQEIMNRMPPGNAFSTIPIELSIHSPKVLQLTLVDLPGLVRNVVMGQPESTIQQVREMILSFITPPETLILAVTPANQDLCTSDALKLAKLVDPNYERTIGVLTKIDRMEEGTNAQDTLENRKIRLKRGYVGVINRSQKDILENRSFEYIIQKERDFFHEHPCYSHLAHRMGTPYLRQKLQKTLRDHIRDYLPNLRSKMSDKLSRYTKALREINANLGNAAAGGRKYFLVKLINSFIDDITAKLMGNAENMDGSIISPGAFMYCKLNTEIQKILKLVLIPNNEELTVKITSAAGVRGAISFPPIVLNSICKDLVSRYESPMENSVVIIQEILQEAVHESAEMLSRYPKTKNEVLFLIHRYMNAAKEDTQEKLRNHVEAEMFYINLEHPDLDLTVCNPVCPPAGPNKLWENTDIPDPSTPPPETPPSSSSRAPSSSRTAKSGSGTAPSSSSTAPSSSSTVSSSSTAPASATNGTDTPNSNMSRYCSDRGNLLPILMKNEVQQKKVQYITLLITKYLEIVQKSICDVTVKYILRFLIKKVLDDIKDELIPTILGSSNLAALTDDCSDEFRIKEELETNCRLINEALAEIQAF